MSAISSFVSISISVIISLASIASSLLKSSTPYKYNYYSILQRICRLHCNVCVYYQSLVHGCASIVTIQWPACRSPACTQSQDQSWYIPYILNAHAIFLEWFPFLLNTAIISRKSSKSMKPLSLEQNNLHILYLRGFICSQTWLMNYQQQTDYSNTFNSFKFSATIIYDIWPFRLSFVKDNGSICLNFLNALNINNSYSTIVTI